MEWHETLTKELLRIAYSDKDHILLNELIDWMIFLFLESHIEKYINKLK
jgi:hypothetical protein